VRRAPSPFLSVGTGLHLEAPSASAAGDSLPARGGGLSSLEGGCRPEGEAGAGGAYHQSRCQALLQRFKGARDRRRSMGGCTLKPILAATPARSISLLRPASVNGASFSETKNVGRLGLAVHSARNSSPNSGCVPRSGSLCYFWHRDGCPWRLRSASRHRARLDACSDAAWARLSVFLWLAIPAGALVSAWFSPLYAVARGILMNESQ
jgi:hypothetical protein